MTNFSKGEIVWAKMVGYPYYPATIKCIYYKHKKYKNNSDIYEDNPTINVEFYGDHSKGEIDKKHIEKFVDYYKEFSQTKRAGLIKAINEAKKDYIDSQKNISPNILFNVLGKKRFRIKKHKSHKHKKNKNECDNKSPKVYCLINSNNKINFDKEDNINDSNRSVSINSRKNNDSDLDFSISIDKSKKKSKEAIQKIKNLSEDLIKCKVEVRRKEYFKKAISDIEELLQLIKSDTQITNFESVSNNFFNLS